jgi:nicotinate-nucleotide adenylyltransferase
MRVGLFFGSFNPVHVGHLIIAETVVGLAGLHEVWLVVSPHNPFKEKSTLANDYDRLHLVHLATHDNPRVRPCDVEFQLPKPSYTIDTLTELAKRYPTYEFCLLMGEDNLAGVPRWKKGDVLLQHYELVVYPRLGSAPPEANALNGTRIRRVAAPVLELSATEIRRRIQAGESVRYMLTDAVREHIEASGMYRQ